MSQQVKAASYRGKKINVNAVARVQGMGSAGRAEFWLRVTKNGNGPVSQGVRMKTDNCVIRSDQWREYLLSAEVAADADLVTYGLSLVGDGTVWIDDITVDAVKGQ